MFAFIPQVAVGVFAFIEVRAFATGAFALKNLWLLLELTGWYCIVVCVDTTGEILAVAVFDWLFHVSHIQWCIITPYLIYRSGIPRKNKGGGMNPPRLVTLHGIGSRNLHTSQCIGRRSPHRVVFHSVDIQRMRILRQRLFPLSARK